MRVAVAGCVAALFLALAGCGGSGGAPAPAGGTHRARAAEPSLELTPSPGPVTPLVGKTTANRAVCWHFVRARLTRAAGQRFVLWLTSGPGNQFAGHASPALIKDITAWHRDTYGSPGRQARAGPDLAAVLGDCRSIGIFGPG